MVSTGTGVAGMSGREVRCKLSASYILSLIPNIQLVTIIDIAICFHSLRESLLPYLYRPATSSATHVGGPRSVASQLDSGLE